MRKKLFPLLLMLLALACASAQAQDATGIAGYSKASGCLAVAQALGEDLADCYAIGDSANDLEMLQCVGHPLVMGNAPARVQAVAEYVTGTPAEDGLYHAMVHAGLLAE